jgi:hypothetical protein
MKIYIDNYPASKLSSSVIRSSLEPYRVSFKNVVKLISPNSGIFIIEYNKTFKLSLPLITKPSIEYAYKGFPLILQNYDYIKEEVLSQLPVDCIQFQETTFKYAFNKLDPRIFLYIVGVYNTNGSDDNSNSNRFIPTDFYFETNNNCEGINNSQFQEEFSGFLSLLK